MAHAAAIPVDRGTMAVLTRAHGHANAASLDHEVAVRGGDEDLAGSQGIAIERCATRQPARLAKDVRERAGARRREVQDDANGGWEICG